LTIDIAQTIIDRKERVCYNDALLKEIIQLGLDLILAIFDIEERRFL
jgi:hypothetical protein